MSSRSACALCRTVQLQLSRARRPDRCVGGRHNLRGEYHEDVLERVGALDGGAIEWDERATMKIPGSGRVRPCPLRSRAPSAGWWLGDSAGDPSVGTSVTWMGQAAALAVELVAQGRVVPNWCNRRSAARIPQTRTRHLPAPLVACAVDSERLEPLQPRSWPGDGRCSPSRTAPNSRGGTCRSHGCDRWRRSWADGDAAAPQRS